MKRPIPCAHCGKSVTQQKDLVTRIVHLNFAYFCSEHCANKLKLPGLAPTPPPPQVMRDAAITTSVVPAALYAEGTPDVATDEVSEGSWSADVFASDVKPISEQARILLSGGIAFLGLFARSAAWSQWMSAAGLIVFLMVILPHKRWMSRAGTATLESESLGAYTLGLGLWAYVASVFTAAWWFCALFLAAFAWLAFWAPRVRHLPAWLQLFASGEWHWGARKT